MRRSLSTGTERNLEKKIVFFYSNLESTSSTWEHVWLFFEFTELVTGRANRPGLFITCWLAVVAVAVGVVVVVVVRVVVPVANRVGRGAGPRVLLVVGLRNGAHRCGIVGLVVSGAVVFQRARSKGAAIRGAARGQAAAGAGTTIRGRRLTV